jgi:flagellar basal body-associated protein FliL
MNKTVTIFKRTITLRQLILGIVAVVIIIVAGIYLIRFFFPSKPEATKAATTPQLQEQQIDTGVLNQNEFKSLEEQGVNLDATQKGRTNPFLPTSEGEQAETGGSIESQ